MTPTQWLDSDEPEMIVQYFDAQHETQQITDAVAFAVVRKSRKLRVMPASRSTGAAQAHSAGYDNRTHALRPLEETTLSTAVVTTRQESDEEESLVGAPPSRRRYDNRSGVPLSFD